MRRILLIEDQQNERLLVRRMLKETHQCFHGEAELVEAQSWEYGMSVLECTDIDVILLDLTLLPDSASQTAVKIASIASTSPPIVVWTGSTQESLRETCIANGAEDFVLKASSLDTALSQIQMVLAQCYNAYLRRLRNGAQKTAV